MEKEKRKGDKPIPDNLKEYLNDAQRAELHIIEGFGWDLKYVRRPLFQDPVLVVSNSDGSAVGTLESNGELNLEPNIKIRNWKFILQIFSRRLDPYNFLNSHPSF